MGGEKEGLNTLEKKKKAIWNRMTCFLILNIGVTEKNTPIIAKAKIMFVELCRCVGYFTIIAAYLELSFYLYFYKPIIDSIHCLHSLSTSHVFITPEHWLYVRKE